MRRRFPKPSRPIATDQGVATRRRRGAFVESWWAERWISALERLMDTGRLGRGRRYARAGQVLSLHEEAGVVVAQVQGSRPTPYRVTVGLAPLSDAAWKRVYAALARRADLAAALLAGEMPRDIDEVFAKARTSLFPTAPSHLHLACTCPDWVTVCKHVAATCYLLGEQFDEDPFLLFRLRGRDQDEILASLQQRPGGAGGADEAGGGAADGAVEATAATSSTSAEGAVPARVPIGLEGFWTTAEEVPGIDAPTERPDLSLLRRLGPFAALDEDLLQYLGPLYRAVAVAAEAALEDADAVAENAALEGSDAIAAAEVANESGGGDQA